MEVNGELGDIMDDHDWALIFDNAGHIKGVFIPQGSAEEDVPENLLRILKAAGIDIEASDNTTIH